MADVLHALQWLGSDIWCREKAYGILTLLSPPLLGHQKLSRIENSGKDLIDGYNSR